MSTPTQPDQAPRTEAPSGASSSQVRRSIFNPAVLRAAVGPSFAKLDPRTQIRNPVMFVVEIGAAITAVAWLIQALGGGPLGGGNEPWWFTFTVSIWLWLTVVFANFADALAEGRGKAQAAALRALRTDTMARLRDGTQRRTSELRRGDVGVVEAGEMIPGDGTIVEGIASVDESAITGESAPVIREAGGDRSAVTGGTMVLSDRIVVEITAEPGRSFLDRMIALVEGADRRKTPNEIALNILLAAMTAVFLVIVVSLRPFALFAHTAASTTTLIALLVALIPTTIGALLSAIGIAGMDRLVRRNVLAMSGRAVEASGDVDVLLLGKTGTITLGNRQATEFLPLPGVDVAELADAAQLSSLSDETPRAARSWCWPRSATGSAAATCCNARPSSSRSAPTPACPAPTLTAAASARAPPTRWSAGSESMAAPCQPSSPRWWRPSPAAAAHRWWSPTAPARSAWSTSKTSSRAASASASTSSAA